MKDKFLTFAFTTRVNWNKKSSAGWMDEWMDGCGWMDGRASLMIADSNQKLTFLNSEDIGATILNPSSGGPLESDYPGTNQENYFLQV